MARSQKIWIWIVVSSAALMILGVLLWFLAGGDLDRNDKIASVVSMFVGLATLAIGMLQRPQAPPQQAVDDAEHLNRAAETLSEAVRVQWEAEAGTRSLRRPEPLRLRWLTTGRPVAAHPAMVVGGAVAGRPVQLRLHGRLDEVGEAFMALPQRRLVVLGEPEAGKTVLAILLTLELLARRRPSDAVPVLLSISSWNPNTEHLHAWIARRLNEDYPALRNATAYGPEAAQRLVTSGRILPILDDLDELPTRVRATAIRKLDRAHAGRPLVVTCRSVEYQEAVTTGGEILSAAAVVELQPVTVQEAITFMKAAIAPTDTRWDEVFSHLRTHPAGALAATLSSPLMVALARAVYTAPDREPYELVETASRGDHAEVERHLLDSFIPAVFADPPAAPNPHRSAARHYQWDPGLARRYLAFLATHLRHHNSYALAWWELRLAMPRPIVRLLEGLAFGLVVGLAGGLVTALVVGLVAGLEVGLRVGLTLVPTFGLVVGLAAGLSLRFLRLPRPPARLDARIRGRLGRLARLLPAWVGVGLLVGLSLMLGFGLWYRVAGGLAGSLVAGLALGLAVGLGGGLMEWLSRPADYAVAVTAQSVLQSDKTVAMANGLVVALQVGLVGTLAGWLTGGLAFGLVSVVLVLVFLLVFGLAAALAFALIYTSWGWFTVARTWLAVRGQLPWRLMAFLDDAHRRGVLRQAGAEYQFRHARLQDHLAGAGQRVHVGHQA